jgi:hypothetical protein
MKSPKISLFTGTIGLNKEEFHLIKSILDIGLILKLFLKISLLMLNLAKRLELLAEQELERVLFVFL